MLVQSDVGRAFVRNISLECFQFCFTKSPRLLCITVHIFFYARASSSIMQITKNAVKVNWQGVIFFKLIYHPLYLTVTYDAARQNKTEDSLNLQAPSPLTVRENKISRKNL